MRNGQTKGAYVIGDPIRHSLSPEIHNYWLKSFHIDGVYLPLGVPHEDLEAFVQSLNLLELAGANVTLPHKVSVLSFCDVIHPAARLIGAANTIWRAADGKIHAENSDAYGFLENLKAQIPDIGQRMRHKKAILIGAGGAARALLVALEELGCTEIHILNRSQEKAEILASEFSSKLSAVLTVGRLQDFDREKATCSLLVNGSSLGMVGFPALDLDLSGMPDDAIVADIVYRPLQTALLQEAAKHHLQTVTGIGMLLHQAKLGFSKWFGQMPIVDDALERFILSRLEGK